MDSDETTDELEEKIACQGHFERIFESALWNCRFVVMLAVFFGLVSAIALFFLGAAEVVSGIGDFYKSAYPDTAHHEVMSDGAAGAGAHGDIRGNVDTSSTGAGEAAAGKRKKIVERGPKLVGTLIGAVDYFLIGVVLLIFSFGIYELFISHLEIGRLNEEVKILEITNLDDLKNRIIKVVIMVLIVSFFKKILSIDFNTPQEMFYFAGSIFVLCLGVYFMHKTH